MSAPAPIVRLARITHADPGKCACCDREAVVWYRTGVIADGRITVAARYCAEHDPDAHPGAAQMLRELTIADVARLSPARARRADRRIQSMSDQANRLRSASAALAGASSHTHSYALLAGCAAEEAETLQRLAALAPSSRTRK